MINNEYLLPELSIYVILNFGRSSMCKENGRKGEAMYSQQII